MPKLVFIELYFTEHSLVSMTPVLAGTKKAHGLVSISPSEDSQTTSSSPHDFSGL